MFSPQTVFVLGAGASFDLGLPTGDDLRSELLVVLERRENEARFVHRTLNEAIHGLCVRHAGNDWVTRFWEYSSAAVRIRDALPMAVSIDNLLHTHRHDSLMIQLGKLAIATVILEKESSSHLSARKQIIRGDVQLAITNTPEMSKSWYLPLMRLLATGKTVDQITHIFDNIAFVVFNYDRCLEHFLVNALMNYFNVSDRVAINAVNHLTIIHPYGQVGHLKWQRDAENRVVSSFGNAEGKIVEIADQILTFTESANEGVIGEVRNLIMGAETLVFMGFGYLPQNMELLSVPEISEVRRVFATMLGIGENDVPIAESEIARVLKRTIWRPGMLVSGLGNATEFHSYVERGTCRNLMDHHWLRLTRR